MSPTLRACSGPGDFGAISDFLYTLYQPDNRDGNWFQPIWEYAYTHPWFDDTAVGHIGMWEDGGHIVGVCTVRDAPRRGVLQVHPAYESPEAGDAGLCRADTSARSTTRAGAISKAYVNDFDPAFEEPCCSCAATSASPTPTGPCRSSSSPTRFRLSPCRRASG